MKAKPATPKIILIPLCLIPCAWALLAGFGGLDKLENYLLDLRFLFRGDLAVEAVDVPNFADTNNSTGEAVPKVVYVDFDHKALSSPEAGERPWDRKFFAEVARVLLDERVGARVVGYDFIFSNKSMSKMVLEENVFESEQAIGDLIKQHPDKVVLGANYTNVSFEFEGENVSSSPPLVYREKYKDDMARNYPEAPTYPMLFYKDGKPQGRLGILFAEMPRGKGPIPRWAPLYYPYEGDAHAKKQLLGLQFAHPIEKQDGEVDGALAVADIQAKKLKEENQVLQTLQAAVEAVNKARSRNLRPSGPIRWRGIACPPRRCKTDWSSWRTAGEPSIASTPRQGKLTGLTTRKESLGARRWSRTEKSIWAPSGVISGFWRQARKRRSSGRSI
jgi:hypothetical protein